MTPKAYLLLIKWTDPTGTMVSYYSFENRFSYNTNTFNHALINGDGYVFFVGSLKKYLNDAGIVVPY